MLKNNAHQYELTRKKIIDNKNPFNFGSINVNGASASEAPQLASAFVVEAKKAYWRAGRRKNEAFRGKLRALLLEKLSTLTLLSSS